MDARGRFRGIALGFNPRSIQINNLWGGEGFLGADIFSSHFGRESHLINVYGPCTTRLTFWEHLLSRSFTLVDNLILGGDLNFSLGHAESWGHLAQIDHLSEPLANLLQDHHLVDITSPRTLPT